MGTFFERKEFLLSLKGIKVWKAWNYTCTKHNRIVCFENSRSFTLVEEGGRFKGGVSYPKFEALIPSKKEVKIG